MGTGDKALRLYGGLGVPIEKWHGSIVSLLVWYVGVSGNLKVVLRKFTGKEYFFEKILRACSPV